MAAAAFLNKYFGCVDSMPQDLQRFVSRLREVELEKKELFSETQDIKEELVKAVESGSKRQRLLFRQLQECLLLVREVGNTKLEISAQMLDKVEEYSQQLGLCSKDLEMNPHSDDVLLTPRGAGGPLHYHINPAGESPMSNGISESKSSVKRSSSSKRPRQPTSTSVSEKDEDTSVSFIANGGAGGGGGGGGGAKEVVGAVTKAKEGVPVGVAGGGASTGNVSSTNTGNGKPPKKKIKTMKKKVGGSKDKDSSTSTPAHMPMPDLTSQPLDPNEPTYCLCQQVSFGEMIGCDNEDCQIEWFHFQCVGLTSKPKGKWFCPSCSQERKSKSGK